MDHKFGEYFQNSPSFNTSSLLEFSSFALLSNDADEECIALKLANEEVMEEFDITKKKLNS